ncbi:MAG: pantoate--beta-alanine ligase, partial [Planctomycetota bacterium]
RAPAIHRALLDARGLYQAGERSAAALTGSVYSALGDDFAIDYVEIRDEESFLPVADPVDRGRVVVAARLGGVRLLDNVALAGSGTGTGSGTR